MYAIFATGRSVNNPQTLSRQKIIKTKLDRLSHNIDEVPTYECRREMRVYH